MNRLISLRFVALLFAISLPFATFAQGPAARQEITVSPDILAQYVGQYTLAPNFILTVTLENGQLMTQATGQQKVPVFAETETRFFLKVVVASIEFQKGADGTVTGLVLQQNGQTLPAPKTSNEVPPPVVHNEITLPEDVLARYVGNYSLPNMILAVTLENGQLMMQPTGQSKQPIFAEAETKFFVKIVEATIEFQLDATGKVTGLVLNQSGRAMPAPKQ